MKQGILCNTRVRLLLKEGSSCYRTRRVGERKRKSVRGCIVGSDLSVLNLVIMKKGEQEIADITETPTARRLGPKRANKIRKLFNLTKDDDVRKYMNVLARKFTNKKGNEETKRPKIQRLVTPVTVMRKKQRMTEKIKSLEVSKANAAAYTALVKMRVAEQKEARRSEISKRRSSRKASRVN